VITGIMDVVHENQNPIPKVDGSGKVVESSKIKK
jgi:hypothetical protein